MLNHVNFGFNAARRILDMSKSFIPLQRIKGV